MATPQDRADAGKVRTRRLAIRKGKTIEQLETMERDVRHLLDHLRSPGSSVVFGPVQAQKVQRLHEKSTALIYTQFYVRGLHNSDL